MNELITYILPIIENSWFLQGLIVNSVFTIGSIPFSKKIIRKIFKNRKEERIKNAQNELEMKCMQKLIADRYIDKDFFENQLIILASKYNLEVTDIYNNEEDFGKTLISRTIGINLIDNNTKEDIVNIIRNNKLFMNYVNNSIVDENENIPSGENDISPSEDNINHNQSEQQNISKFTLITTVGIFVFLLFIISIAQILYSAYGINVIILIVSIMIMIIMIPLLINGIFHYEEFNTQGKRHFYLFITILLLNIINFICMVNILLIR